MSRLLCVACLSLVVASACRSTPEPVPEAATAAPRAAPLELTGIEVTEQSLLNATLSVKGKVGPDTQERTLSWRATSGDTLLGEGEAALALDADGSFAVPMEITFGDSLESLQPYQAKRSLEIVVQTSLGEHQASRSRSVRSPLLPVVGIATVRASRTEAKALSLTYSVTIHNPNPFEVRVRTLRYEAGLGGKTVAQGELPLGSKLPPAAESMFDLPAELNTENAGADFNRMVRQTELEWRFTGALDARELAVPFELTGTLPIAQN